MKWELITDHIRAIPATGELLSSAAREAII
jgi:hypothetical protein